SLALGGALAAVTITMKIPWIILIAGFVYVIEALSVVIQVVSFKSTGRRVFKMTPIHHHFELSGWKENTIVAVFVLATVAFAIAGLAVLRINVF
ncbi:MAG: phospho-N-acetylmuramoyl-pentapeptide-transferase, partial [Eubacteriales bacterium]|nr:phospho-N-acetylmuramoyl-pentapeptide-transferase [Eubacteriales bacterium]